MRAFIKGCGFSIFKPEQAKLRRLIRWWLRFLRTSAVGWGGHGYERQKTLPLKLWDLSLSKRGAAF